jgi:hypothetical protein
MLYGEVCPCHFHFRDEDTEAQGRAVSTGLGTANYISNLLCVSLVAVGRLLALSGLWGNDTCAMQWLGERRLCRKHVVYCSQYDLFLMSGM